MEHLSEERLLELADGGLADDHVRECAECARAVAEQRAALAALRAAPLLELPRGRVQGYAAALPEQTRVRRLRGWPQRLAILAPVAAAALAILISGRGGDEARVAEEGAAEDTAALSAPAAAEGARSSGPPQLEALTPQTDKRACPAPGASLQAPIAEVEGPQQEVVRLLRAAGIAAAQCNEAVEVYGADADAVRDALDARRAGDVAVRAAR